MEDILDKSLISDTSICNLLMRAGSRSLDVAIYSVMSDNSLIYRSFPLGHDGEDYLSSLESAIYDNPLLLGEFRRTFCIADTGNAMVLPAGIEEAADRRKIFLTAHPGFDGEILVSSTGTRNARIVFGMPGNIYGFLRRTFHGLEVDSHLSTLCRYFAMRPGRGNSCRMVCNFRSDAMDVIAIRGTELRLANTFTFKASVDAVYYIMAVRKSLGLDATDDELLLTGDQRIRNEITPMLRKFIARVMPAIFPPQMFRTGKESLRAPFDLIIAPLCE